VDVVSMCDDEYGVLCCSSINWASKLIERSYLVMVRPEVIEDPSVSSRSRRKKLNNLEAFLILILAHYCRGDFLGGCPAIAVYFGVYS
jgi:hypothetical protein